MPGEDISSDRWTQSARGILRQWINEQINTAVEDGQSISIPTLTSETIAHFRADGELIQRLMEEQLQPIVTQLVAQRVGHSRNYVLAGDRALPRHQFAQMAEQLAKRWERWIEHVGVLQVPVLSMTKTDLVQAAMERENQGRRELRMGALWRSLADQLKETECVGDRFTSEQIEQLYQSLEGEV